MIADVTTTYHPSTLPSARPPPRLSQYSSPIISPTLPDFTRQTKCRCCGANRCKESGCKSNIGKLNRELQRLHANCPSGSPTSPVFHGRMRSQRHRLQERRSNLAIAHRVVAQWRRIQRKRKLARAREARKERPI